MNIAIIPARGGSKRIPRKNIRQFCGKPMVAWSIETALESGCFQRVIVSTDDAEIAEVARQWGAEVPFCRPAELSDDFTGTIPVIAHAVEWLRAKGNRVDDVCCIYATAPFLSAGDLEMGYRMLSDRAADYAVSVTTYAFPIQRALRVTRAGHAVMFNPSEFSTRSQDLEEAWHDAGQFYWGRSDAWCSRNPIFSDQTVPVKLPRHRVQDIDTLEDWVRAEWLFNAMRAESNCAAEESPSDG